VNSIGAGSGLVRSIALEGPGCPAHLDPALIELSDLDRKPAIGVCDDDVAVRSFENLRIRVLFPSGLRWLDRVSRQCTPGGDASLNIAHPGPGLAAVLGERRGERLARPGLRLAPGHDRMAIVDRDRQMSVPQLRHLNGGVVVRQASLSRSSPRASVLRRAPVDEIGVPAAEERQLAPIFQPHDTRLHVSVRVRHDTFFPMASLIA
jgi:hypothetical protein